MRKRIYIAGPISKGPMEHNINQANEAMVVLMRAGFAPFNPMLSCFVGYPDYVGPEICPRGTTHEDWYGMDLEWVGVCDGVLRLPGESVGADLETQFAEDNGIPIFYSLDELIEYDSCGAWDAWKTTNYRLAEPGEDGCNEKKKEPGDPGFLKALDELRALHQKKSADYGSAVDPLANFRKAADAGVEPWLSSWLRAKDKVQRIDQYCLSGLLANEGVQDSFADLAGHSLICLSLFREAEKKADYEKSCDGAGCSRRAERIKDRRKRAEELSKKFADAQQHTAWKETIKNLS